MARLPRFCPAGLPQHIIQRGNNRQICFGIRDDYATYAHWLNEYAKEFGVAIHAWVFMTNHVHMLATPSSDDGVSLMMQSLGRRYVRYFNRSYQRTGTLWEGRFKSCIVYQEDYLLAVYRYIELNPVRARMVVDPAEYHWSSYQSNALDKQISLRTPHSIYQQLGRNDVERRRHYQSLFKEVLGDRLINEIRDSVQSELALGSQRFKREIEALYGRRVTSRQNGRPRSTNNRAI